MMQPVIFSPDNSAHAPTFVGGSVCGRCEKLDNFAHLQLGKWRWTLCGYRVPGEYKCCSVAFITFL